MKVTTKEGYGVVSTNIVDVNNTEMRQMMQVKNRVNEVLASHKNDKVKNEYLNDDELLLIKAIFNVFTKGFEDTQTSSFDEELVVCKEELDAMTKTSECPVAE